MATRPLSIPTPDGSGQTVHPDVVWCEAGFAGYQWWMACTPYPFFQDQAENPIIRVSADGVTWHPVLGAPDPLVPPPREEKRHWSDTDLVLHDGRLHLFFRGATPGVAEDEILLITSNDGVTWSQPSTIMRGGPLISPAVVAEADRWRMWWVESDGTSSSVWRADGPSPDLLERTVQCTLEVPGHVVWHLDVSGDADGYQALVSAFPAGADNSRCRLFHFRSSDGARFRPTSARPVLRPRWWLWSSRMIYRASLVQWGEDAYSIWYSGASWSRRCGIGLAIGPLGALKLRSGSGRWPQGWRRLREDVIGFATYSAQRRLPAPARDGLRRLLSTRARRGGS